MTPSINVIPHDAALDVRRRIVLDGFPAGLVELNAELHHPDGSVWHSQAIFKVSEDGHVDLDHQAPLSGNWQEADAMGLVWSMQRIVPPDTPAQTEEIESIIINVSAKGTDAREAKTNFIQHYVAKGVTRRDIHIDGIVGTVFTPSDEGSHPVIVVMNGSGGGIPWQRAALWASHGYTAFALGYFKAPGLPDYISKIPLEYFEHALRWARETLDPRNGFVAVTGQSRGGELSLLLGARFPELVNAVIAYVPSSVIHGTLRAGKRGESPDSPVWTWHGRPLPNIWQDNSQADWTTFTQVPKDGSPVRQAPAFLSVLRDSDAVKTARIPVENIRGPVLLISGTDDGFWPSTLYCQDIVDTLERNNHPWAYHHVLCEGAGHSIGLPNKPATEIAKPHPVANILLTGGGTASANAHASETSWHTAQDFLSQMSKKLS